MQIDGIKTNYNNAPAFNARISDSLTKKILQQAVEYGVEGISRANKQISQIRKWGHPNTEIVESYDMQRQILTLGAKNDTISRTYGAPLIQPRGTLFDDFISLREEDILRAEKQIKKELNNCQNELLKKALGNPDLQKRITGVDNPSKEELFSKISSLPEEQLHIYRFDLFAPTNKDDTLLDFII